MNIKHTIYNMTEVRAHRDRMRYRNSIDLTICNRTARNGPETVSIGKLEFRELSEDDLGASCPPTLTISDEAAQQLMDELWTCGLRPSEGAGSAGQLGATQRHLEDMRAIVFKTNPMKSSQSV